MLIAEIPTIYLGVMGLGFVAAVGIGSIAWYNSERPSGWEDKERPDFIPKVDKAGNEVEDK
ncbi:photosystem II assembly protein Psb35 [Leptolyngbya sp. FACHB-261]|uniref:photosystem II assembly protein Psb35 n=1 Tax=Leptolyngbya sp. FACHB-261 TaxID=2692806 RepID=UPI00168222AA|nr:hypothetical protein [Leptolyngbya sp. FACHB-261]MBD2101551.1 hypothetical protein [Leptolyngbya sp. FACHB-261]